MEATPEEIVGLRGLLAAQRQEGRRLAAAHGLSPPADADPGHDPAELEALLAQQRAENRRLAGLGGPGREDWSLGEWPPVKVAPLDLPHARHLPPDLQSLSQGLARALQGLTPACLAADFKLCRDWIRASQACVPRVCLPAHATCAQALAAVKQLLRDNTPAAQFARDTRIVVLEVAPPEPTPQLLACLASRRTHGVQSVPAGATFGQHAEWRDCERCTMSEFLATGSRCAAQAALDELAQRCAAEWGEDIAGSPEALGALVSAVQPHLWRRTCLPRVPYMHDAAYNPGTTGRLAPTVLEWLGPAVVTIRTAEGEQVVAETRPADGTPLSAAGVALADDLAGELLRRAQSAAPGGCTPLLPGITAAVGIASRPFTCTPMHYEDADLDAANMLLYGAPKIWVQVPPSKLGELFAQLPPGARQPLHAKHLYHYLRAEQLRTLGALCVVQRPGQLVLTLRGVHWTTSCGTSLAEAANCMLMEAGGFFERLTAWVDFAAGAAVCEGRAAAGEAIAELMCQLEPRLAGQLRAAVVAEEAQDDGASCERPEHYEGMRLGLNFDLGIGLESDVEHSSETEVETETETESDSATTTTAFCGHAAAAPASAR